MRRRAAVRASYVSAFVVFVVATLLFNVASVSGDVVNTFIQVTEPLETTQDSENVPSTSHPPDTVTYLPTEPVSPGIDEGRLTVRLVVQYDSKPEETSFLIRREDGDVIYRGPGEYEPAPNEKWDTRFSAFPQGSFTFEIFDAAGNGMRSGNILGSYEIWQLYTSGSQKLLARGDHNFGSSATVTFQTQSEELPQTLIRLPVVEVLLQLFTLTQLEAYVSVAGVASELSGDVAVTMVMPWNFGFQRLEKSLVEKLRNPKWNAHLRNLIEYHMFDGDLTDVSFENPVNLTMKNNEMAVFSLSDSENPRVLVNNVNTVSAYDAANGFVYVLERVLTPAWLNRNLYEVSETEVSIFTSLIVMAGLDADLQDRVQNLTIFAPDDTAFNLLGNAAIDFLTSDDSLELLTETLRYHVAIGGPYSSNKFTSDSLETLQGGTLQIIPGITRSVLGVYNQASITMFDKLAKNGIMHIVDRVILLGALELPVPPSGTPSVSPSTGFPSSSPSRLPTTSGGGLGNGPEQSLAWIQLGQDIDGRESGDLFSYSSALSISADGSIVAAGAPQGDGGAGYVRVFHYDVLSSSWTQLGQDLVGGKSGDAFGSSLELSADGKILAIGAVNDGGTSYVSVLRYDDSQESWVPLGQKIDGASPGDGFGESLALSSDGKMFVTGFNLFTRGGRVRAYSLNTQGLWQQLGQELDDRSIAGAHEFGRAVALSENGKILAIGAPAHANGAQVQVFELVNTTWVRLGEPVLGTGKFDNFGDAVALSSDGFTLAAGAISNSDNGRLAGQVIIQKYNESEKRWERLGQSLNGEAAGDFFGDTLDISADGLTLAVGAPTSMAFTGTVYVYRYDSSQWIQVKSTIQCEGEFDLWGDSVALSADGNLLAAGARYHDGNTGHVRVYELS